MFKLKDFYPNQASFIGIKEPVKEAVYQFKGYTRKDLDEFDAMAHRAGFRGTPDFNKMTYTTDEISRKLDKIVKSKGNTLVDYSKIKFEIKKCKYDFQEQARRWF